jgi:hypothetical protein
MPTQDAQRDIILACWSLPLQLATRGFEFWLAVFSSHRLSADERDDQAHRQLIVPEPLKRDDDRDLFA